MRELGRLLLLVWLASCAHVETSTPESTDETSPEPETAAVDPGHDALGSRYHPLGDLFMDDPELRSKIVEVSRTSRVAREDIGVVILASVGGRDVEVADLKARRILGSFRQTRDGWEWTPH